MQKEIEKVMKGSIEVILQKSSEDGDLCIFSFEKRKYFAKRSYKFSSNRIERTKMLVNLYEKYFSKNLKHSFSFPKLVAFSEKGGILVFEYVRGRTLKEIYLSDMNNNQLLSYFEECGEKLRYFHRHLKIIHGDFRLWNIIVSQDSFYLVDTPDKNIATTNLKDIADFLNSVYFLSISPLQLFKKKISLKKLENSFLKGYYKEEEVPVRELSRYKIKNLDMTLKRHPLFIKGKNYLKEIGIFIYLYPFFKLKVRQLKNEL